MALIGDELRTCVFDPTPYTYEQTKHYILSGGHDIHHLRYVWSEVMQPAPLEIGVESSPPITDVALSENPFLGPVLSFPIFHAQNNLEVFSLLIGEKESIRFRASKDASSANILGSMLIGKRLPIRLDMMGRVSAWYRFKGGGSFLSGHTKMADLPKGTLELHMVPNDTKWVQIEVPSKNIKLVTSVGVALPMLSIIDHLVCWLKLPRTQWKVSVNGHEADYYDILMDFPLNAINSIQLYSQG